MPPITLGQVLAVTCGMLAFLSGATAQLADIFNPTAAKTISTACGLIGGVLSVPLTMMFTQSSQLKAVQSMPGVEKITVNQQANPTLASLAVSEEQPKIEPAPGAGRAVHDIAKGSS